MKFFEPGAHIFDQDLEYNIVKLRAILRKNEKILKEKAKKLEEEEKDDCE